MKNDHQPMKDDIGAHPIADAWRPTIREIARAMKRGDYGLSAHIPCVAPVAHATAEQIRAYVADYRETLAELPDETWNSSVAQWMGTHWEAVVDLWTAESGASDLVLHLRVFEAGDGFRFEIDSVHVP